MLPPTMRTAPTSAIALPKPATSAATTETLASATTRQSTEKPVAPRVTAVSRTDLSTEATADHVSAATIGVAMADWAMTIAGGEYRRPMNPSGPLLDSRRYTTSPATTGGRP